MLAAALAIAGAYADFQEHSVQPANVRLGAGGLVQAWLAAGPFPNEPDDDGVVHGLATQWIGSEANANPVEGKYVTHLRDAGIPDFWRFSTTGPRGELDFNRMFNGAKPGVAYAFVYLVAAHSGPAVLSVEGGEQVRLLLNGQRIFEGGKNGAASARIATHLDKGPNRVLLKIVHAGGIWQASLRVSAAGVYEQLSVYPEALHTEPADLRAIRAMRGKTGALDLDAALAYDKISRRASQWAGVFQSEIPHQRAFENILSEASRFIFNAQDGNADTISVALRRATNLVSIAFDQSRKQVSGEFVHPKALLRGATKREDYIRLDTHHRGFLHANGKPFVPVGFTQTLLGDAAFASNPNNLTYDPERTDNAFAQASDSGVDIVRLNIDPPTGLSAERLAGFNAPEHIKWIDNLLLVALKHSVKLLISAGEQTSLTEAELQTRWRTIIDRWGNSGAVFAWELPDHPKNAALAEWIRHYESAKWGRNHLIGDPTADFTLTNPTAAHQKPTLIAIQPSEASRQAAWIALTSGSAGVLLGSDPKDNDLDILLALRTFGLAVDWPNLWAQNAHLFTAGAPRRWTSSAFGDANSAIVWAGGPVLGDQIVLDAKCPIRKGRFRAYDCIARTWLGDGTFNGFLTVPPGLKEVAWILKSR